MTLTQVTTGGVDENINIDSNTLKVDGTNNRVGIGTASPSTPLTVQSDSGANNTRFVGRSTGDNRSDLQFYQNNGTSFMGSLSAQNDSMNIFLASSSGDLKYTANQHTFRDENGFDLIKIDSAGNVGINTSSPTSYGNSQATLVIEDNTNPAICWSDTGQTRDWWAVANGSNLSFIYADGGGSGSASNVTNVLSMANSGNVGIGINSPSSKLHVNGTITDSIGPIRRLGITAVSATGNLSANDAGKLLRSTGTVTLTIPSGTFTAGDMITIFNVSSGDNTITQGSGVTLYNTADAATGNRTLAAKGVCTIACTSTNEFIISGSGLS